MNNRILRAALFEADMKQYQLAELLGVSEGRVSTMLRRELPANEQQRLVRIIKEHRETSDAE